jgi:hypothetical protein
LILESLKQQTKVTESMLDRGNFVEVHPHIVMAATTMYAQLVKPLMRGAIDATKNIEFIFNAIDAPALSSKVMIHLLFEYSFPKSILDKRTGKELDKTSALDAFAKHVRALEEWGPRVEDYATSSV